MLAFLTLIILLKFKVLHDNSEILQFFNRQIWFYFALVIVCIREFLEIEIDLKQTIVNPAQLFIFSFLLIIVSGSFFLMLPNATTQHISLMDALFTSTSAVCVTGLAVVDTGSVFTELGQITIVALIQIGGLGIMTFASYFSYFVKGSSSFKNQLVLLDMANTDKIGEVFVILKKILIITFTIEAVGAILIFYSLDVANIPAFGDRVFFSIFHSVSGFCNAGFSTLRNGLYETGYRFNYSLHLTIAALIVFGGLGFPIIFNLFRYLKRTVINKFNQIFRETSPNHLPWVININTRIVLITTIILLVGGTALIYIFEYNNTLAEHSFFGKIVTAFFGSVTTRTAGFNSVDFSVLTVPTVLVMIFLMWVGASPASTGGGIKTTTLAVAVLNILSLAKSKSHVEIFKREIAESSIKRAFAIIILSFFVISISTFLICIFDYDKGLLNIAFECFSAYGTVGLSRGITAGLSDSSKFILIMTMFIGRVNMLTILIALFRNFSQNKYRYPTEVLLIN
jgi:potassium uptake TrkH family protein